MREILQKYLPEKAVTPMIELIEKHPIHIKIVNNRQSKHGDFRRNALGETQITINYGLNPYHFVITLVHEIAHFVTYKQHHNRVRPHGIEWKRNFQHLMLPFLSPDIFPQPILPILANYLKNPKASTGSDPNLMKVLNKYNTNSDHNYIFELEKGEIFSFRNQKYRLGDKKRTRYECIELSTNKKYLINQNAPIERVVEG
ncbi:MAG: sprT domain-containing protein [Flavobacteriaceae bacterium]|nr:sprT domain-containing protein [Flavobacteriaceae bacterium]